MEFRSNGETVSFTESESGPGVIEGYGVRYYDPNDPGTEFVRNVKGVEVVERVMPGAFDRSLQEDDQRAFWDHKTNAVLGRRSAGTLSIRNDSKGIFYSVKLPNTTAGNDAAESVRRKDVNGSSFGFSDRNGRPNLRREGGRIIREIRDGILGELSPTAVPAYGGSSAALIRSSTEEEQGLREAIEQLLDHDRDLEKRSKDATMRARIVGLGID